MRALTVLFAAATLAGCPGAADPVSEPICRNGVVEGAEACDDGNGIDNDGCSNTCVPSFCGDGVTHETEACDDANDSNEDACVEGCQTARCGDGFTQIGVEECDDANAEDEDACLSTCRANVCGDGIINANVEFCDDGNRVDTDGCTNACAPARCGDGVVQEGVEACDDGNESDTDDCTSACEPARCGDGFVQAGEGCDDGNEVDDDECSNACTPASCGDGIVQEGEACDDGNDDETDACLSTCAQAQCGDGQVRAGVEECDDGNAESTDECTARCTAARCGDGFVQTGVEQCDDGNIVDTDGCTNACAQARCGDGIVQDGAEACDDGNAVQTDACLNSCEVARCGDGFAHEGVEACDDGNELQTDACLNDCQAAACGDGFVHEGVEECDDQNRNDSDLCISNCRDARCGDGFILAGSEDCDDGNVENGDGCDDQCGNERPQVDPAQSAVIQRLLSGEAERASLSHVLITYANASNLQERGFVVQAERNGRALAISVSAASLGVRAGDIVSLDVTRMYSIGGLLRAAAVENVQILARSEPLGPWTHDFNVQRTLPTEAMAFWRVSARLSIPEDLRSAGGNYVSAPANTAVLADRREVQLRINNTLQDGLYVEETCELTVTGVPLVRYGGNSQYTPTRLSEVTLHSCPPTEPVAITATSATELRLEMRRNLRPETVSADDFMISIDRVAPQLAVQAAVVTNGRFITLTTAPQVLGQRYEIRRVGDVLDLAGQNIALSTQPIESFIGYRPPARMLINELNANASSGCDLIEFRVTQGGLLRHVVKERTAVVYAFPEVMVATDDIVVLHFNRGNANCVQSNPAGQTPGYEAESTSQFAQAQIAANYDTAWDHWTTDSGLTATDNVISLLLDDTIVDAVLVSDAPTGNAAAASESAARTVAAASQWTTEAGQVPEGGFVDGDFNAHAAQDLNGAGTRNGTNSIRRTGQTDRNHKGDWSFGASSFGRAN